MAIEIFPVGNEACKPQSAYTAAEPLANLLSDLAEAGPAEPEVRQAPLQEFAALSILHSPAFGSRSGTLFFWPGIPGHPC